MKKFAIIALFAAFTTAAFASGPSDTATVNFDLCIQQYMKLTADGSTLHIVANHAGNDASYTSGTAGLSLLSNVGWSAIATVVGPPTYSVPGAAGTFSTNCTLTTGGATGAIPATGTVSVTVAGVSWADAPGLYSGGVVTITVSAAS